MRDLIKRLRGMAETGWNPIGDEAADVIDELEAENVLLRDSLKQLVNLKQFKDMYGKNVEDMAGKTNTWRLALRALNSTPQTAKVQNMLDAARELSDEIKTVHLDMGGKHRYALGHKTHELVTNLKSAVREYKGE